MNKAKFHFHTTNVSSRFIIKYSVKGGREMADTQQYDDFIRSRITELRMSKAVSEHRMSLDLGKSGSYICGFLRSVRRGRISLPQTLRTVEKFK